MYQNTNTAPYFNANLKMDRFTSIIGISLDRAFSMRQNSEFRLLFIFLYSCIWGWGGGRCEELGGINRTGLKFGMVLNSE